MKKLGIALGGGGAKGVAHVLMLEALEELSWQPYCIAGTSIGAIVGALYASGNSAKEMRDDLAGASFSVDGSIVDDIFTKDLSRWWDILDLNFHGKGLLDVKDFLARLASKLKVPTFEELAVQLRIVAADFWQREPIVFESGPLLPAVHASMALPGVFQPVQIDGRVLIDGGVVNPVPFDVLPEACDVVVAVDVIGQREPVDENPLPSFGDAIFNTVQIFEKSIVREKLQQSGPTIYIEPEITDIKVLEFFKAADVFRQAEPAKQKLKSELEKLLV
jgi:NTE family protein